jgi:hypothetical protein
VNGKLVSVRRVLYEAKYGPIPEGKVVAVTCECPKCIRHFHLETIADVSRRVVSRGAYDQKVHGRRVALGRRRNSDVSDEVVAEIRASTETHAALARRMNLSESYICAIRLGRSRKDYSNPFAGLGA